MSDLKHYIVFARFRGDVSRQECFTFANSPYEAVERFAHEDKHRGHRLTPLGYWVVRVDAVKGDFTVKWEDPPPSEPELRIGLTSLPWNTAR